MKIWIITWRYYDGSGSGVLNTAYQDEATAHHVFSVLVQQDNVKMYELEELNVLRTEKTDWTDTYRRAQNVRPPWFDLIGVPGTSLSELNLSVRTEACLKAEGVDTVEKLMLCPESVLLRFPNLGRKSLNEIKQTLESKGIRLQP